MRHIKTPTDLAELLAEFDTFNECLVDEMRFVRYGLDLEIDFNHIWREYGNIRDDLDTVRHIVRLLFRNVSTLNIRHDFGAAMLEEPHLVNWGSTELSIVRSFVPESARFGLTLKYGPRREMTIECHEVFVQPERWPVPDIRSP